MNAFLTTVLVSVLTLLLADTGMSLKCAVCDTEQGNWDCVLHRQPAQDCDFDHCIVVTKYDSRGKLESFTRSCSPIAMPEGCSRGVDRLTGENVSLCYTTCSEDYCNTDHSLGVFIRMLGR